MLARVFEDDQIKTLRDVAAIRAAIDAKLHAATTATAAPTPAPSLLVMLAGLVWLFFMMRASINLIRLAPKGQRMRTYNRLSMWNFGQIRADIGPAAEPHLRMMRRGVYAFAAALAAVLAIAAVSAITTAAITGNPDAH